MFLVENYLTKPFHSEGLFEYLTINTNEGIENIISSVSASGKGDYSLEYYVLSTNHYQIELLTNLDKVPEYGALAVVTFPKPKNGSGFPARVFAILPWNILKLLFYTKKTSQALSN